MPTLTRPMQIQILADLLAGQRPERLPTADQFTQPLRAAWQAVVGLEYQDSVEWLYRAIDAIRAALGDQPDVASIVGELLATDASGMAHWAAGYPSLAEIFASLPPITWIWPGWLPSGMLSLLAARPGTGKSFVALDLARRIIHAEPWPDGATQTRPGWPVLWIEAENVPQILAARAETWKMDTRKLYLVLPDDGDLMIDMSSPKYQELVFRMATRLKPGLIVVDSLSGILPGAENGVEDVRQILFYLNSLAGQTAAGLLVIHHLRKGSNAQMSLTDGVDIDMIRGSGHIAAITRVAWGLSTVQTGPDPDRNGPRRLEVIKTNLGRYPDPLGITLQQLHPEGVRLDWTETAPRRYQEPTAGDACAAWLLDYLAAAGPEGVSPKTVVTDAAEAGFNRAALYRARESLASQIANTHGRRHPSNAWVLAGADSTLDE